VKRRSRVLSKVFAQFRTTREPPAGIVLAIDVRLYCRLAHDFLTNEKPFGQPLNIVLLYHVIGHNPGWVIRVRTAQQHLSSRTRLYMLEVQRASSSARHTLRAFLNTGAHNKEILEIRRQVRLRPSTERPSFDEVGRDGTTACDGILQCSPRFPVQLFELVVAVRARSHLIDQRHLKVILKILAHTGKVGMHFDSMSFQQCGMTNP
jgi:hypothetical protein